LEIFIWQEINVMVGAKMDESVAKMIAFLENNYKIIRIKTNYTAGATGKILEYTVYLEKGTKKEIIHSSSNEFVAYMMHFKRIKNSFNNDEFIFIDKINNYEKQTMGLLKDQVYLEDNHLIRIMDREFKNGIITLLFKPASPTNKYGIFMFLINLKINPDFLFCDLKDEIQIYERTNNKLLFTGLVKHCHIQNNNTALIVSQDHSLKLETTKLSTEFVNMNGTDCLATLASSLGLDLHSNREININERDFIIIVPVKNLIINESFIIGNVEFYQEFNTLDDHLIRKSKNGRTNPEWNGNYPRAKIIVKANQFFPAIKEGFRNISTAVDLISLRTDISYPRIKINDQDELFVFDYYTYFSRVKLPTWVYCREIGKNSYTIFNVEFLTENILAIERKPNDYFSKICDHFKELICKRDHTQQEKNMLQVLHWLRRAIQTGENKDKLLDLWTAMEFLVSRTRSEKIFCKDQIEDIKKLIDSSQILQDNQKGILYKKLDMANDVPLMQKIKTMVRAFEIELTAEEQRLLKSTRDKRNDLIHGKNDIDVTENELNKLRSIIEILLMSKISIMQNE
jgi:hypothetical protein